MASSMAGSMQVRPGTNRQTKFGESTIIRQKWNNPYLKYLKKLKVAEEEAKKGPNLAVKAEETTIITIRNFLHWYNSLGSPDNSSESTITEATLRKLFEIGFDTPTIQKQQTEEKESKEINRKHKMESGRSKRDSINEEPDLSMIWAGIEDLDSTIAFCKWLQHHPEEEMPAYLKSIRIPPVLPQEL